MPVSRLLRFAAIAGAVLAIAGAASSPAAANERDVTCGGAPLIDLGKALEEKNAVERAWGRENIEARAGEEAAQGPVLRVAYPAGSFSPGQSEIRGGAGFVLRRPTAATACLSYKVRFPEGFDFVKGGKLPGLFGGDAPTGCVAPGKASGFSARLMWRAKGAGELYLYAPGRQTRCGASLGRGDWVFQRGRWTTVTQRVSMGASGANEGSIEISIDGRSVFRADGLTLGDGTGAAGVDGLLFATFFGGGDAGWATPRDQFADFADFRLSTDAD